MNTSASVIPQGKQQKVGGSLAEHLFHVPLNGYLQCDECRLPVAEVRGECLVVRSHHYGKKHTTVIPLENLGLFIR